MESSGEDARREREMTEWELTAHKAHRCVHCGEEIGKFTRYRFARITPWDHEENEGFSDYRAHPSCHAFWETICHETDGKFGEDPQEFLARMMGGVG